jgi:hypothetical protein
MAPARVVLVPAELDPAELDRPTRARVVHDLATPALVDLGRARARRDRTGATTSAVVTSVVVASAVSEVAPTNATIDASVLGVHRRGQPVARLGAPMIDAMTVALIDVMIDVVIDEMIDETTAAMPGSADSRSVPAGVSRRESFAPKNANPRTKPNVVAPQCELAVADRLARTSSRRASSAKPRSGSTKVPFEPLPSWPPSVLVAPRASAHRPNDARANWLPTCRPRSKKFSSLVAPLD